MSPLDPSATHPTIGWLTYAAAWMQWLLAPLLSSVISFVYYTATSPTLPQGRRVLVSIHGLSIAAIYCVAMIVFWAGVSKPSYAIPFVLSLLLPVILIAFALFQFKGRRVVHWLQLLNLLCLAWVAFIGIMAITGEWL